MEMWLKRLTLLLLTALVISGQVSVILDETLKEKGETVAIGSSVIFKCRLKIDTNGRFWVKWYFNPSGSSFNETHLFCNESAKPSTVVSNQTKQDRRDEEQCCIKSNVTDKDSGWYFCEVTIEIPTLMCKNSSGTKLIISQSKEHTTHPPLPLVTVKQDTVSPRDNFSLIDHWMWILLGVSAFILIVLLVLCVLLRRRLRRSRGEDPIYANTRPVANKQPSPRPAMPVGNLKTASSSQNLRNPSPGRRYDDGKQRYKH
ncbi:uncharacterized protein LOC116063511 isoform X1 [Sander lucioperca]|uniref:uncharacterized protein LOC116063511 isoform X1 n=1 Tax=Sander lucioperca TaxID=283035 RepID=UPI00125E8706|nr:uncharacterized protein LOC116063511 isoform X1 [Sander lucioperca]XP_031174368.1 uncharacterized protein LOC116063511 isoform X1 [Sander lucioperca]